MKSINLFFIISLLGIIFSCKSQLGWKLVWEENFDKDGVIDEAVWSKIPRGRSDWQRHMSDYDVLYDVKDGKLILRGMVNPGLNGDSIAYQTIHSHYTYRLKKTEPKQGSTAPIKNGEYNTYSVELWPDSVVFSINGKRNFHYPRIETDLEGQFPFDRPFYLLLDMQLGGSWVGAVNPDDLPVEMYIDWVRFYEWK